MKNRDRATAEPLVVECDVLALSVLDRSLIDVAYFRDSYRAVLNRKSASVVDLFLGIFAHHPLWMKAVLIVRNRIASLCGLEAPTAAEIVNVEIKKSYSVGDKIGVWPIFALTETELVAGRDNKHLDFRVSVLKEVGTETTSVVVSTLCKVHNVFGKIYLFFIVPFHKWGVRRLMSRAIMAGRL